MDNSTYRERAGTLICIFIMAAYVAVGYVAQTVTYFHGTAIAFPADWNTTMQNLALAALGYLIGKQTNNATTGSAVPEPPKREDAQENP